MSSRNALQRTPALWTLYALLGLYSFLQNAIGPAVPFLRAEFHLGYTLAALHISAFAIGMVASGFLAPLAIRMLGVSRTLWGGQLGTFAGITALVLAPAPWVSLVAILFAGFTGTVSMAAAQASVAVNAGLNRAKALLEANIASSLTSAAGPLVLVIGTWTGTGWRTLWPAFALALAATWLLGYRALSQNLKAPEARPHDVPGKLPRSYLRAWLLIFFGVGVEWSSGFWAAEHLKGLPGGSIGMAAAGAGVFQLAAVLGRLVSSRLTGRYGERKLLVAASLVMAAGFPLYWLLWSPWSAFTGLALLGFGASAFYPMGVSLAIGAGGNQPAKASSLVTVASGGAILVCPLTLGAVADQAGLSMALLAIPGGLVVILVLLLFPRRVDATATPR